MFYFLIHGCSVTVFQDSGRDLAVPRHAAHYDMCMGVTHSLAHVPHSGTKDVDDLPETTQQQN